MRGGSGEDRVEVKSMRIGVTKEALLKTCVWITSWRYGSGGFGERFAKDQKLVDLKLNQVDRHS